MYGSGWRQVVVEEESCTMCALFESVKHDVSMYIKLRSCARCSLRRGRGRCGAADARALVCGRDVFCRRFAGCACLAPLSL